MEDVKFNWDTKKHDEKVPPKSKVIEAACPHCGEKGKFARLHRAIAEIIEESRQINLSMAPGPLIICSACSNITHVQGIIQNVGKVLSQQATQRPGETTH